MTYTKYFDFDMLNKHFNERLDNIHEWILLAIIMVLVYLIVKMFLYWDK